MAESGMDASINLVKKAGLLSADERKNASLRARRMVRTGHSEYQADAKDPVAAYFNRLSKVLHPSDVRDKKTGEKRVDANRREARNKAMIAKLWPKAEKQFVSHSILPAYLDKLEAGRRTYAERHGKEFVFDRTEVENSLLGAQRERLRQWFDYLIENTANYDPAFLYYVWRGATGIRDTRDDNRKVYNSRDKDDAIPMPPLNVAAIDLLHSAILEKHRRVQAAAGDEKAAKLDDWPLDEKVTRGDFKELYYYFVDKCAAVTYHPKEDGTPPDGDWVSYSLDDPEHGLEQMLEELQYTGWCVRGREWAKEYLERGPARVFFANQDNGKKVPCASIATDRTGQPEIRGTEYMQGLHMDLIDIVKEKMRTDSIQGNDVQEKQFNMMGRVAELARRMRRERVQHPEKEPDMSADDLRLLYGFEGDIRGFGHWDTDPQVLDLLKGRDRRQDLATMFECEPDEVALTAGEFDEKKTVVSTIRYGVGKVPRTLVKSIIARLKGEDDFPSKLKAVLAEIELHHAPMRNLGQLLYAQRIGIENCPYLESLTKGKLIVRDSLDIRNCPRLESLSPELHAEKLGIYGASSLRPRAIPENILETVRNIQVGATGTHKAPRRLRRYMERLAQQHPDQVSVSR